MWSQSWERLESYTQPYPNVDHVDITENLIKQVW